MPSSVIAPPNVDKILTRSSGQSLPYCPSLSSTLSFSSDSNSRSLPRYPTLSSTSSISSFSSDNDSQSLSRHPTLSSTSSISSFSSDNDSQSLSRYPTLSSTSSISSFSSDNDSQFLSRYPTLSSTSSISSFSLDNDDNHSNGDLKLTRILSMVQEIENKCRNCWVNRTDRSHLTWRCFSQASKGGWELFKKGLLFEPGQVCFYCLAPYSPPFNHAQPSPGTSRSHKLCQYKDTIRGYNAVLLGPLSAIHF